jgi:hypothetical protein
MLEKLPARTGVLWVRQGLALFRRQPAALMALFFSGLFLMLAGSAVPLLGQIMFPVLMPLFSIALLQACAEIDQGRIPMPGLIFIGFRQPQRSPLLLLGGLNIGLALVSGLVLYWLGNDTLQQLTDSKTAPTLDSVQDQLQDLLPALWASCGVFMLGWLVSCFAAPLIFWQRQGVGKALFFSAYAVLRSFWAFILGGVCLYALFQIAALAVRLLAPLSETLAFGFLFLMFMIMIIVAHCMVYASYCRIFGAPSAQPQPAPTTSV